MNTKLLHFTTLFREEKKKKKKKNIVTYQPHSVTLTYSNRLLKIIPTKLVNTHYRTISHISSPERYLGLDIIYVVE